MTYQVRYLSPDFSDWASKIIIPAFAVITMSEAALHVARRRRNGKEASCEPCRKVSQRKVGTICLRYSKLNRSVGQGKLRCDHQHPTCARCQYRGRGSRCYYHPAPLTKSRDIVISNNGEPVEVISTPQSLPNLRNGMLATPTQLGFYGTTHEERLDIVKVRVGFFLPRKSSMFCL